MRFENMKPGMELYIGHTQYTIVKANDLYIKSKKEAIKENALSLAVAIACMGVIVWRVLSYINTRQGLITGILLTVMAVIFGFFPVGILMEGVQKVCKRRKTKCACCEKRMRYVGYQGFELEYNNWTGMIQEQTKPLIGYFEKYKCKKHGTEIWVFDRIPVYNRKSSLL